MLVAVAYTFAVAMIRDKGAVNVGRLMMKKGGQSDMLEEDDELQD